MGNTSLELKEAFEGNDFIQAETDDDSSRARSVKISFRGGSVANTFNLDF